MKQPPQTPWTPEPLPVEWQRPPAGRVLCFAPHPDDEVIGPGGALALHRDQGDPVRVIVASSGAAANIDDQVSDAEFIALRQRESRAGLAVLDIDDVRFWSMPDSYQLSVCDVAMGAELAAGEIREFAPDVVYAPWALDGHGDHMALHHAVVGALDAVGFSGVELGYEVYRALVAEYLLNLEPVMERKERAVRCHESQMAKSDYVHVMRGLHAFRSVQIHNGFGMFEAYAHLRGAKTNRGAPQDS